MAGKVIPDLRTGYRAHLYGEVKIPGIIYEDVSLNGNLQLIEDHDIKFINGGKISNCTTYNGIDLSSFKADYDSKIDQNVKLDSSPQFGDLKVASVVCPNYPGAGTGLFNGVDLLAFKTDYDLKVNQNVKTTATPSFAGLTVGTVGYPTSAGTVGYVLTQGEDGNVHFEVPNTTLPGRFTLDSGTAGIPSYSWSIDGTSGLFYDTDAKGMAWSHCGTKRLWIDDSGLNVDDDVKVTGTTTTDTLTVNNNANITGQVQTGAGSVFAPSYSWPAHTDMGMYDDSGSLAFSRGATKRVWIDNSGFNTDVDTNVNGTTTTTGLTVGSATFSTPGTAPVFGCRGFALFDGRAASDVFVSGTYSQSGTTATLTVTSSSVTINFSVNNLIYVDFTSGSATDGSYQIASVVVPGSVYTIGGLPSVTTSGNFTIRVRTILTSGNVNHVVSNLQTGQHIINFTTALPTNYSISALAEFGFVRLTNSSSAYSPSFIIIQVLNTGGTAIDSFRVSVQAIA